MAKRVGILLLWTDIPAFSRASTVTHNDVIICAYFNTLVRRRTTYMSVQAQNQSLNTYNFDPISFFA